MSCLRPIHQDLDQICGGQGRMYIHYWRTLVNAFESAGIELLFVKDGPPPEYKRPLWVKRKYEAVKKFVYPVFDSLVSVSSKTHLGFRL